MRLKILAICIPLTTPVVGSGSCKADGPSCEEAGAPLAAGGGSDLEQEAALLLQLGRRSSAEEDQASEDAGEGRLGQRGAAAADLDLMPTGDEWDHFHLVQELRKNGHTCPDGSHFPPNPAKLHWDCRLFRAARLWATRMARENFVAHRRAGSDPCQRTSSQGVPRQQGCGENIATGHMTSKGAFEQLKKSIGHCLNMMEPSFNKLGVGYAFGQHAAHQHYWVDSFGAWPEAAAQECIGGDPAPALQPGCVDTGPNCATYKGYGMCDSPTVSVECKATCGIGHCGVAAADICMDTDHECDFFQSLGYCDAVTNVQKVCRKTCNKCGVRLCEDTDTNCNFYHREGYCKTSGDVQQRCLKTCGLCAAPKPPPPPPPPPGPPATPPPAGACEDVPTIACNVYRGYGFCGRENVKQQCRKTCGACGAGPRPPVPPPSPPPEAVCSDTPQTACDVYKGYGFCVSNEHVRSQCKKTCGICDGRAPPPPTGCIDVPGSSCAVYKGYGYCSWVENVKLNCKRTCNLC